MLYRTYGKSDVKVSEIGMGGHREGVDAGDGLDRNARFFRSAQERARVVGRAIDQGVTYFDTTYGCELASLGESLRLLKRREGLFVSGMRVDFFANMLNDADGPRAYVRREVEARVRELGVDVLDQFLLGAMEAGDPLSHPRTMLDDALDELLRLRDAGKFRFLGFSTHLPDYAARMLETFPVFDTVMTPYNFANRAAEGALADALRKSGAAWIAMKTLVWHIYGIPVTVLRHLKPLPGRVSLDPAVPIATLAHRFVLQNPLLTTCVPAMNTVVAVDENVVASAAGPLDEASQTQLHAYADAMLAENLVPLAIGGLLEDNMRVQFHALSLCRNRLGLAADLGGLGDAGAEARVKSTAAAMLGTLRGMPEWSPYLS